MRRTEVCQGLDLHGLIQIAGLAEAVAKREAACYGSVRLGRLLQLPVPGRGGIEALAILGGKVTVVVTILGR